MPIGASLGIRSAALFFEKVIYGFLPAEAYSEPTRTSKMELFTKIVNGLKSIEQFSQKALC